jgi:hypothetical protein
MNQNIHFLSISLMLSAMHRLNVPGIAENTEQKLGTPGTVCEIDTK